MSDRSKPSTDWSRLTAGIERQITEDWQRELPGLSVYRRRHLLRRVGPLLVGVCLDRDSSGEKYIPCSHVHCLAHDFPTISLTLCTQLRTEQGNPDFIKLQLHSTTYREAASRIARQTLLPLNGPIALSQAMTAYRKHMATPLGRRQKAILARDCILLLAWSGRQADALHLLELTLSELSDEASFQTCGGRIRYSTAIHQAIEDPDVVRQTVQSEIQRHRVESVMVNDLIVD